MRAEGAAKPSILGGPVVTIPTPFGTFHVQVWSEVATGVEHMSLSADRQTDDQGFPLVRLHSECLTGDVFGSYRCDCGEQLDQALALINLKGGTVIYLRGQEGRGIGLADKVRAYALQEEGADTVEANEQLGLPVDARDYQAAAEILHCLNLDHIALLTNNPDKSNALANHGITVEHMVPSEVPVREENRRYLETKRDRMHHRLLLAADYIDAPLRQS